MSFRCSWIQVPSWCLYVCFDTALLHTGFILRPTTNQLNTPWRFQQSSMLPAKLPVALGHVAIPEPATAAREMGHFVWLNLNPRNISVYRR